MLSKENRHGKCAKLKENLTGILIKSVLFRKLMAVSSLDENWKKIIVALFSNVISTNSTIEKWPFRRHVFL